MPLSLRRDVLRHYDVWWCAEGDSKEWSSIIAGLSTPLKTKLLIATGPAGGVRPDSSSDEEEDPETLRRREKEQAQQRKAAAAKVKKKGKKEKVTGRDGRELEMERSKTGKVVIAAEAKHRSTKKKYQDRRSTAEKDRSDSSSKYKLNKVRTRRHLLQPPA